MEYNAYEYKESSMMQSIQYIECHAWNIIWYKWSVYNIKYFIQCIEHNAYIAML